MSHKRRQDLLIPLLTVISDAVAIEASFLFSVLAQILFYTHAIHSNIVRPSTIRGIY